MSPFLSGAFLLELAVACGNSAIVLVFDALVTLCLPELLTGVCVRRWPGIVCADDPPTALCLYVLFAPVSFAFETFVFFTADSDVFLGL